MRFFLPALLVLPLSTLTLGRYAGDFEVDQVRHLQHRQDGPGDTAIASASTNAVPGAGSSSSSMASTSSMSSMSMTSSIPSSVSVATTATASGTATAAEQGAGLKAMGSDAQLPSTSSSKGGAPMATGHWAAVGIVAIGVGGLMV
ncbi:hypothetical protein MMC08_000867 [Hypocenomyce scalaris]|nr:hypothetical protein [Hypocenomyce scalaris]